jgi:hypothetical protein
VFFTGFRGVNASNATALDLATRTPIEKLQQLVVTGFSLEDVAAAVFSVEMGRQQDFATERNIGVKLLRWAGCTYSPRGGATFIGACYNEISSCSSSAVSFILGIRRLLVFAACCLYR